ncbi:MAG: TetR family transcriptional regulator [Bauldia sp.]
MARASREQAAEHHGEIVTAASRLFRERGIKATSVPDIMGAAGLTHGGFYKHFPSKEALAAAACADGFAWLKGLLETIEARHPKSPPAARADLIAGYLAPAHRDDPGDGCPAIAWATTWRASLPTARCARPMRPASTPSSTV